jgi:two-component system alkaline phosphatase synthesis response regulator PhoP
MKGKILIIEDEEDIVKGITINLKDEGYTVDWAPDGETGLRKSLEETPDLIILDIMLPEMDGLDVCRELRKKDIDLPILMLTAKNEEIDRVVGLEIGADDYITKPFSVRELIARVKAHLRRVKKADESVQNTYSFGDVEIDFVHYKIRRKGTESDATSLEMKILNYFIQHRGQVVSRDDLLNQVWGYDNYPTTRTIDNHILKIRKKIEEDPVHPRYIHSVYGGGYRFSD